MMTLRYNYKSIDRKEKTPSIPVILVGENTRQEFMALVDSGADISFISKGVAEILGLNFKGLPITAAKGIGGEVPSVQTKMGIHLGRDREIYNFVIPVKIAMDEKYNYSPILGRYGFFDKFIITFDENEKHVTLKIAKDRKKI